MADPTVVRRISPGDHVCWTFADEQERRQALAGYVRAGLDQGHKVLCATHSTTETLAALDRCGVSTTVPLETGQLLIRCEDGTTFGAAPPDPADWLAAWDREIVTAQDEGWSGLRVAGDMTDVRAGVDADQLVRYEAQVNRVVTGGYATALCFYDRRLFTGAELNRLASAHPGTAEPDADPDWAPLLRIRRTTDPPGLRLSGEADLSNRRAIAAVLAGLFDDVDPGGAPVTVDVSGLSFADGAAAHLLVRAAESAPTGLRLVGCPPALRKVLEVVSDRPLPFQW